MIDMCVRFRDLYGAINLFNQMDRNFNSGYKKNYNQRRYGPSSSRVQPSAVTYGIIIKAYGQENQLENAFKIFCEMKRARLVPSAMTYGCLL